MNDMGMMFCIMILTALLAAAVFIKIFFCLLRVMVSLVFLPLLIVGAVFFMLPAILGLIALPIMLPVLLILFIFLILPFLLIKRLVF
jgi:hypothetical protein